VRRGLAGQSANEPPLNARPTGPVYRQTPPPWSVNTNTTGLPNPDNTPAPPFPASTEPGT
ncbi:MAG TPA: hypothetical protein VG317_08030, partial [Pseudonocardiaceae bacterium]|nr:hypothetical protein [Pseudonocardiaceae bacterium]